MGENMKDPGTKKLPTNLNESLEELEKDETIKRAIGKEAAELFVNYKQKEWQEYISETTDLEYRLYFHC